MQNEISIVVGRPADEVFRAVDEHLCEWSITCVEDELLQKTPEGVGTTFRVVTEDRGRRMTFAGLVTRYDPPRVTACHLAGPYFDLDVEYTFERVDGGTRVTQRSAGTGKGFMKILLPLLGWMMKRKACDSTLKELESLKTFCESRA